MVIPMEYIKREQKIMPEKPRPERPTRIRANDCQVSSKVRLFPIRTKLSPPGGFSPGIYRLGAHQLRLFPPFSFFPANKSGSFSTPSRFQLVIKLPQIPKAEDNSLLV